MLQENKIETPVEDVETHGEDESTRAFESPQQSAARKRNRQGLVCLKNGVVAMRDLGLASRIPTKTRDEDAPKMFQAKLTLSKAFTMYTMMVHGAARLSHAY